MAGFLQQNFESYRANITKLRQAESRLPQAVQPADDGYESSVNLDAKMDEQPLAAASDAFFDVWAEIGNLDDSALDPLLANNSGITILDEKQDEKSDEQQEIASARQEHIDFTNLINATFDVDEKTEIAGDDDAIELLYDNKTVLGAGGRVRSAPTRSRTARRCSTRCRRRSRSETRTRTLPR